MTASASERTAVVVFLECRRCGRIENPDPTPADRAHLSTDIATHLEAGAGVPRPRQPTGSPFRLEGVAVYLRGRCARCRGDTAPRRG